MDVAIVVAYLAAMIAFGFWGKRRAGREDRSYITTADEPQMIDGNDKVRR